jgi:hypothetical protein
MAFRAQQTKIFCRLGMGGGRKNHNKQTQDDIGENVATLN